MTRARVRAAYAVIAAAGAVLLQSLAYQPVGSYIPAGVAAFVLLMTLRPAEGLILFAGLSPVGPVLFTLAGNTVVLQVTETLGLAVIVGWSLRRAIKPAPLAADKALIVCAALLAALALASAAIRTRSRPSASRNAAVNRSEPA